MVFTKDKSIFDQFFTKKKKKFFFFVKEIAQKIGYVRVLATTYTGMTKMTVFWLKFRLDNFFLDLVNPRFS